jgi:uncharacterized protein YkwD
MRLLLGVLVISILLILLLLVKVKEVPSVVAVKPTPYVAPTSVYIPDNENDLFEAVNEWRVQTNRPAYKKSDTACGIASKRVPEIKIDYSHDGFYKYPKAIQTKNPTVMQENILADHYYSDVSLNKWLNSPPHRKALEADYTHSCIKCDSGYCVHIFSYF